jgi:tetratricopeptide (TPR) repeat protein
MKPWQLANYLVADRNPVEAFEIIQEASSGNLGEDYAQHCTALAKSLSSLTYYEESLKWAKKACEAEPKNSQFTIVLADAYFLSGNHNAANKIYESLVSLVPRSDSDSISDMFSVTFAFDTGVLPSPIFAIRLGKQLSDPRQSEEFWKLAEIEFYYSHYFRLHHAYYLAAKGKQQECLAKLITLVQEMPWLEEASLSLKNLFDCFNQSGNKIMPEFQEQLSQKIQERGWKGEKMFSLNV